MRTGLISIALAALLAPASLHAEELASEVRGFAEITAGAPLPANADAVLAFERDGSGELVMTGMGLVAKTGGSYSPPRGAVAILRTRSANSEKWRRPDSEDLRFASQFTGPVFVLGANRAEAYWELDARSTPPKFRTFDQDGKPGDWTDLAQ